MTPFFLRVSRVARPVAVALVVVLEAARLSAQTPPPINETIALEGTMKRFYRAANVLIVTTIDGVDHAYRFATDLIVHGGKGSGLEALAGLNEGATVVVHYTTDGRDGTVHEVDALGNDALKMTEGVVVRVDRRKRQITVRYGNGTSDTFALTERAAIESQATGAPGEQSRIVIYYTNEAGKKVVHYYRKIETR